MEEEVELDLEGIYYDAKHDEILLCERFLMLPWIGNNQFSMRSVEKSGVVVSGNSIINDMLDGELFFVCEL
jgi:hypothetical protein